MVVRSSRGAIAWGISLITFPWLAIPLYWILGNNEFQEYAEALQKAYLEKHNLVSQAYGAILEHKALLPNNLVTIEKLVEKFTKPFGLKSKVKSHAFKSKKNKPEVGIKPRNAVTAAL